MTDKVNAGNLEAATISGDTMYLRGWHVATDSEGKGNTFVIILDSDTNQELARYEITPTTRSDVYSSYSGVNNSINSGFEISVPYTSQFAGKNLTIISRYTSSSDGNSDYVDYYYYAGFAANDANLDNFSLDSNGELQISGWHAADASLDKQYHFIIIYDATTNKEISRTLVPVASRNDVAAAYPDVYNAINSGFSLSVAFSSAMAGDDIEVISRYSDSANGEGNKVDYWFAAKQFNTNVANLETFKIDGSSMVISGWHASDLAVDKSYHYIIIYDETKNTEIERVLVPTSPRTDVGNAYQNVYNSNNSGFSITVPLTADMVGDQIQVISRYSDSANGEGNRVDYWFNGETFNVNDGHVDSLTKSGDSLSVSGWHVADESIDKPYHYVIIWDASTGKEIGRYLVKTYEREDVSSYLPDAYNSLNSGFSLTIPQINIPTGDSIQVISRYSNSSNGEGNYIDFWYDVFSA